MRSWGQNGRGELALWGSFLYGVVGTEVDADGLWVTSDSGQEAIKPVPESGPRSGLSSRGPIGRVAMAGAMIVMLMIVAVGVSVWRSETSATLAGVALGDEKQLATAVSGHDLVFDRATVFAVNRPLTAANRADLTGAQHSFETTFGVDLKTSARLEPVESRILARVRAANRQLVILERTIQPLLGRRVGGVALETLRLQRQVVDSAIDAYVSRNGQVLGAAEFGHWRG